MRKIFNAKMLVRFIFATFVVSMIYTIVKIILAPGVAPVSDITVRVKSDYILLLLQCSVGIFALVVPRRLWQTMNLRIPSAMMVMYAIFLYCAIYLGEFRDFYYKVPHWDTVLHTFSGAALGAIGFSLASLLNKSDTGSFSLSPVFVSLFAFCFAIALGVVWEIYEFSIDYFFKVNMQKHSLECGDPLIGQEALKDTMKDLIVDSIGALVMSIIGFISLKHEKGWMDRLLMKRK